jgi:hypothetical protein
LRLNLHSLEEDCLEGAKDCSAVDLIYCRLLPAGGRQQSVSRALNIAVLWLFQHGEAEDYLESARDCSARRASGNLAAEECLRGPNLLPAGEAVQPSYVSSPGLVQSAWQKMDLRALEIAVQLAHVWEVRRPQSRGR